MNHTQIRNLWSYIFVQTVQEGHRHNKKSFLPKDSSFHFTHIRSRSTKQMEDICRQESCSHSRGNSISFMETCAISIQSCWFHFKRFWTYNTVNIHTMVEGKQWLSREPSSWLTTEINTHKDNLENRNVPLQVYNLHKASHEIFKLEQTHHCNCVLQKIHKQLQNFQSQQAINYPLHTIYWQFCDLLLEDDTTSFLNTRNENINGSTRGWGQQISQDTGNFNI